MAFTDLITGLAFVNAHVGFIRLDKDLRENINVPIEKLQAHVQLLSRSAQAVTISNQIQQLKGQANKLLKQQLNAQHAQLMVQVGQLQLQLQQLQVERQRLELEVKKEQRLAQENEILRIFVDFYDQAQTYRQQGQLLDYLVVVFATFRVYRQVYSDLDDANNRLRISDLREKLFQGLRDIVESPQSRQRLVDSYTSALQVPVALVQKGYLSSTNAKEAINEVNQLRQLPPDGNWSGSLKNADSCLARLEAAKDTLVATRTEYIAFSQGIDLREFFFPNYGDSINAMVSGMAEAWAEWLSAVEIRVGNRLTQLYSSLQDDPPRIEQQESQVTVAIEEVKHLRLAHQLGQATVYLAQITPVYLTQFQILDQQFKSLVIPVSGEEPGQVLEVSLAVQQLNIALATKFTSFQEFVKVNGRANENKYLQLASSYMQEINATEENIPLSQIANAFNLRRDIDKLSAEITKAIKMCKNLLDKVVESDDLFERIQQHSRRILPESVVKEIETQTASYQPGALGQILSSVRGEKGKEVARRRRLINNLLEMYPKLYPLPVAQLPEISDAPAFPTLTPSTKRSPLQFAESDQKLTSKKLSGRLAIIGGLVMLIGCVFFLLMVGSRMSRQPTETPSTTGTQLSEAAGLVSTTEVASVSKPVNTPKPTDSLTSTPTRKPVATNTPTNTPKPTATATETPVPSDTPEPTNTPTSVLPTVTPVPPTATPLPPTITPVPIPENAETGVYKEVGTWGMKLYDVKRAKAVWFFGDGNYAQGMWFIPFLEFKNNGTGTRNPGEDFTFYFVDDQGRIFDFDVLSSDGILGAAHQFTSGHYYDDIDPGLVLGISLPIDTPEDLGNVWLKIEEIPSFSIYLGNANKVPIEDQQ